jgi:hypothetical protein
VRNPLWAAALVAVTGAGCLDFDGLITTCLADGGCAPRGGEGGGNDVDAATDAGTADAGGGSGGGGGAGGGMQPNDGGCFGVNGWCWENPTPHGLGINALWYSASNDVWAAGEAGLLMRWNGSRWISYQDAANAVQAQVTGDSLPLEYRAAWAAPTGELWFAGTHSSVLRWTGSTLVAESVDESGPFDFRAISGSSTNAVLATSLEGKLFSTDGGGVWSLARDFGSDSELRGLSVPSAGQCVIALRQSVAPYQNFWADCDGGLTAIPDSGLIAAFGLWNAGPNEVWSTGNNDQLWHREGDGGWRSVRSGSMGGHDFQAGTAVDDGGIHYAAGQYDVVTKVVNRVATLEPTLPDVAHTGSQSLRAIAGRTSTDLWLGGEHGRLVHKVGSGYVDLQKGDGHSIYNLWADGNQVVATAADGWMLRRQPSGTWVATRSAALTGDVRGIWFDDAGFAVAVSEGKIAEGTFAALSTVPGIGVDGGLSLYGVAASSKDDVWTVGVQGYEPNANPRSYHRSATGWTSVPISAPVPGGILYDVTVLSATERWAVGSDGTILTAAPDGGWEAEATPLNNTLYGVFATREADGGALVFAVGSTGTLLKREAGVWADISTEAPLILRGPTTPSEYYAVWASGPNDVWVVGEAGAAIHYDGTWKRVHLGYSQNLEGVAGVGRDIFVGGENGTLLHQRR